MMYLSLRQRNTVINSRKLGRYHVFKARRLKDYPNDVDLCLHLYIFTVQDILSAALTRNSVSIY
jgi:hypothetical protein